MPAGIAVSADGSVYVSELSQMLIARYDADGTFIQQWAEGGQLASPYGIAESADGYVYVADGWSNRITKYDATGSIVTQWGEAGTGNGQFDIPYAIAVDANGNVYVADTNNSRVQKFNSQGNFILAWGGSGSGNGQFSFPRGITVSADGYIYVADTYNHRIQKFDADGNYQLQWGSYGTGNNQFNHPYGIIAGSDGYIYVVDQDNNRVQKFDAGGNYIKQWGVFGSENGNFYTPWGIAFGSGNSIYVADMNNARIQKFNNEGEFINDWGIYSTKNGYLKYPDGIAIAGDGSIYVADTGNNRVQKFTAGGDYELSWGSPGSGDGQFNYPYAVTISDGGFIYVADTANNRIQKFNSSGSYILQWGSFGTGSGQFDNPQGITAGINGDIYVADTYNNRVQEFDSNGTFIRSWGAAGENNGEFSFPNGITAGADGNIFVVDAGNKRVQKFDDTGVFITKWGSFGSGDGEFTSPSGIAIDPAGNVYVYDVGYQGLSGKIQMGSSLNDYSHGRIQKFNSSGAFLTKWNSNDEGAVSFGHIYGIASAPDGTIYGADSDLSQIIKLGHATATTSRIIYETSIAISQASGSTEEYPVAIGSIDATGKLYLEAELTNDAGQVISESRYPFYIAEREIILDFSTDKALYRTGETAQITGKIKNTGSMDASALMIQINATLNGSSAVVYSATIDLPTGGEYPFTATFAASEEGMYILSATVQQDEQVIAQASDRCESSAIKIAADVTVPDIAGNEPFDLIVSLRNDGKFDATITITVDSSNPFRIPDAIAGRSNKHLPALTETTITILPGETKTAVLPQQINADTIFTVALSGDWTQTITLPVHYGSEVSLSAGVGSKCQVMVPGYEACREGTLSLPVVISNSGLLHESLSVTFQLMRGNEIISTIEKSYYVPAGSAANDSMNYDLTEGDYVLTVSSQSPATVVQKTFHVIKENIINASVSAGTQNAGTVPATVSLMNTGINVVEGIIRMTVLNDQNQEVWSTSNSISVPANPLNPVPSGYTYGIQVTAMPAGHYIIKADVLTASNQLLSTSTASFVLEGAVIHLLQVPSYQTFPAGQEAAFVFAFRNDGNQAGEVQIHIKAYDLIDQVQQEWLAPGEEKSISFSYLLPEDSETKDYYAEYAIINGQTGAEIQSGLLKYRVNGLGITVSASLDKQSYSNGETAHLTISVTNQQPGGSIPLLARVNYDAYQAEQEFVLAGTHTLTFDIPLTEVTGAKLSYGIYFSSARSIYLNSLYIYKTGDTVNVITDKQLYEQGETVTIFITSTTAGQMTLNGPGGYADAFELAGSTTRSFALPAIMVSSSYSVDWVFESVPQAGQVIRLEGSHPFDVAGISIKIKEAKLNKSRYLPSDSASITMMAESNHDISAHLRCTVIAPEGTPLTTQEQPVALTESEPTILSQTIQFTTTRAGIHRLFYEIYVTGAGGEEIVVVTASEAFDVGDAVILGLSTEKSDYPSTAEPVTAIVHSYGTGSASISFYVDNQVKLTESINLNGSETRSFIIPGITTGTKTLKAVLVQNSLESVKTAAFRYGTNLADLAVELLVNKDASTGIYQLSATVMNEGKSLAGSTILRIKEMNSSTIIAELPVSELQRGASHFEAANWTAPAHHVIYKILAQVDPDNMITEYNEENNTDEYETEANYPPVALAQTISMNANQSKSFALTALDADGDPLSYVLKTNPAHGVLSGTAPDLIYTPELNYSGADSFTFSANDGQAASNSATVSITISADQNQPPVATNQSLSTNEDTELAIILTATDAENDPLTYSIVSAPSSGTLAGTPTAVTYAPSLNFNGTDSFTFKANDGVSDSNIATVNLDILPVNDAPVAENQSVTVNQNIPANIIVTATDVENDPLNYSLVQSTNHGNISGTLPAILYTPNWNYLGTDSFTFKANDGQLDSNVATVSIEVKRLTGCPDPATIDYKGYTAANCSVPQVYVAVNNQAELDAYEVNFGFDGTKVKNLHVNFNPTGNVVIISPCLVKLNGQNNYLNINADNVCIYGRKGVHVAEDYSNPDFGITAGTIALVSEEADAGFWQSLTLHADELYVQALKEAKIGMNINAYVNGTTSLISTGDTVSSHATINQNAHIISANMLLQASRNASIGKNAVVNVSHYLIIRSTAAYTESEAIVKEGGNVTAGDLSLSSGNKSTLGINSRINVTGNFYMNAGRTCSIASSASIIAGSRSGNCL